MSFPLISDGKKMYHFWKYLYKSWAILVICSLKIKNFKMKCTTTTKIFRIPGMDGGIGINYMI